MFKELFINEDTPTAVDHLALALAKYKKDPDHTVMLYKKWHKMMSKDDKQAQKALDQMKKIGLTEAKVIKKGDEFFKGGDKTAKAVIFIELIKKIGEEDMMSLKDSRTNKPISISVKVFKSSYDLNGKTIG